MSPQDLDRFKHMFDATKEALEFVDGKTRNNFNVDPMLKAALIRELEVIGEAANKISETTQKQFNEAFFL